MTYKNIIDALIRDSGDSGAAYTTNAYTWLSFVRQEAAAKGSWKSAKDSEGSLTTDAGNLIGIYSVPGYDAIIGDEIYDVTNDETIRRDTEMLLKSFDPNQNEYGFPTLWADAGIDSDGDIRVRFWPIPNAAFELSFLGNIALGEITQADEDLTVDPYFGPLAQVGAMLSAGLRFFHDQNDNQDMPQILKSESRFHSAISLYSSSGGADSVRSSRLEPVGRMPNYRPFGRLSPSHFNNRG